MNAFVSILETLDVAEARRVWAVVAPGAVQPDSDADMLVTLHLARTQAEAVPEGLRLYSHAWLLERGLPSQLPDALRPKAERLYPRIAEAVGISVNYSAPALRPAAEIIEAAMSDAVSEAFADGRRDPAFVTARMAEARATASRQLFGRWATR